MIKPAAHTKTALVTGAFSGVGKALVKELLYHQLDYNISLSNTFALKFYGIFEGYAEVFVLL